MTRGFGRLPLFAKLLAPVIALVLIVGPAATFLVVRDIATRDRTAADRALLTQLLDAQTHLRDREVRLFESARFAANLRGMAEAVVDGADSTVADLLRNVVALQPDVEVVAVLDTAGDVRGIVQSTSLPTPVEVLLTAMRGTDRTANTDGAITLELGADRGWLVAVIPICSGDVQCEPVGAAITTSAMGALIATVPLGAAPEPVVVAHSTAGQLLATTDPTQSISAPSVVPTEPTRASLGLPGREQDGLRGPLWVGDKVAGSLTVLLPDGAAVGAARSTADRIALLMLAGIAVVLLLAMALTRSILRQVHELVDTARSLGEGDLSARSTVVSRDEVGELARVLNAMAEEVQENHEHLEERVRERTERVEQLLAERTEFFASLSHELRTPIAIILSQARMRRADKGADPSWDVVATTAKELLSTVNAILDLARAGSGRLDVTLGTVDAVEAVTTATNLVANHARAAGLTLAIEVPDGPVRILADGDRLGQVLINLLDNAIKYTPAGGSVTVGLTESETGTEFTVADSGVGMASDVGERIFEPFFRAPGGRTQRGEASTGLGLALAKTLVEAQGARLTYASLAGYGSTFVVHFPTTSRVVDDAISA